ncbi:MAG: type II toxin-antitoxin system Phd/YefM family antitoxin [Anaerolineales bacterium]|nr:type II toxin-antitoxin system Phd/YefM family antitoxin [Anaerolineales bacterium]
MSTIWKLQDAKAHFSKLVQDALKDGPQFVTRHGKDAVVVLSTAEYEELTSAKPSFVEFLLGVPTVEEFEPIRESDQIRDLEL